MHIRRKMALIPSAYNHKALGDIENIARYYKDIFDVYIISDKAYPPEQAEQDGVCYVKKGTPMDAYLQCTADYVIDAGTISGWNKFCNSQKRIGVWHGTPYKNMFVDIDRKYIVDALDYSYGMDLMVSPSKWYTDRFLRQSMLYQGDVLECPLPRTDSLYITEDEKQEIKETLGISPDKKILLYAPTFRERGEVTLPFSPEKAQQALGENWVIVVKLHYLNSLGEVEGTVDATEYSSVNNLLSMADLLVTDYSSLLFDYSILDKPTLLYQYDREEYEASRSFMFSVEDYIDPSYIVSEASDFYSALSNADAIGANLKAIRENFYPHQHENSTSKFASAISLDTSERGLEEVIFLVNELNQIGGVHTFVMNLARELKKRYNCKVFLFGSSEFDRQKDTAYVFDPDGFIDLKLSAENNFGMIKNILKSTNGYVIACQYGAQRKFQGCLKGKKSILMFHGDTKDVVSRRVYKEHLDGYNSGKRVRNFRRLAFLTEGTYNLILDHLVEDIQKKTIYIENGMDFSDSTTLYKESGDFAFVSRLDPDKNPLEAIEIFASNQLNPSYRLHVYGNGSLKRTMEDKALGYGIQDRVLFHGYIEDKREIYKDKQGVIMVSMTEGLPFVALEAAEYGIPVYIYDSFTSRADVMNEFTGRAIPAGDRDAFVDSLNSPFDIAQFDNSSLMEKFSNDTVIEKWIDVFNQLDNEVREENEERERKKREKQEQDNEETEKKPLAPAKQPSVAKRPLKKKRNVKSYKKMAKKAIRESFIFRNNDAYAELAYQWKKFNTRNNKPDLPLVSIVMPFHNNNETVLAAIKSIERCGYWNYEVIVVNDGSRQDPQRLLKKHKQVRYEYKKHEGPGVARNYGIHLAKGKYVMFLDSDDTLYRNSIGKLVNYAEKHQLNVVAGRTIRYYVNRGTEEIWYRGIYEKARINTLANRLELIDDNTATAKLYNLEWLKNSGISFPAGLYEDVAFMGKVYATVDRIGIISNPIQKWMVYGTSTSISTKLTIANTRERMEKVRGVFDVQSEFLKVYYTRQFIRHYLVACIYPYMGYSEEEKRELYEILRAEMTYRKNYVVDSLILMPSKKMLYRALLENNFDIFSLIAEGYSQRYYSIHNPS